jgi:hypothetical protein
LPEEPRFRERRSPSFRVAGTTNPYPERPWLLHGASRAFTADALGSCFQRLRLSPSALSAVAVSGQTFPNRPAFAERDRGGPQQPVSAAVTGIAGPMRLSPERSASPGVGGLSPHPFPGCPEGQGFHPTHQRDGPAGNAFARRSGGPMAAGGFHRNGPEVRRQASLSLHLPKESASLRAKLSLHSSEPAADRQRSQK